MWLLSMSTVAKRLVRAGPYTFRTSGPGTRVSVPLRIVITPPLGVLTQGSRSQQLKVPYRGALSKQLVASWRGRANMAWTIRE
jgi:hypothetical protein